MIDIANVPDDPLMAMRYLRQELNSQYKGRINDDIALEICTLMVTCVENTEFPQKKDLVRILSGYMTDIIDNGRFNITLFDQEVARVERHIELQNKFLRRNSPNPSDMIREALEVTDSERSKVYVLCREIEDLIMLDEGLDIPKKMRLLKLINKIRTEILEERTTLERVMEPLVDISAQIGSMGSNMKPVIDRMAEVKSIISGRNESNNSISGKSDIKNLPDS